MASLSTQILLSPRYLRHIYFWHEFRIAYLSKQLKCKPPGAKVLINNPATGDNDMYFYFDKTFTKLRQQQILEEFRRTQILKYQSNHRDRFLRKFVLKIREVLFQRKSPLENVTSKAVLSHPGDY